MYFPLNDGFSGQQLWRTDGTSAGTFALTSFTGTPDVTTPFAVGDATWFTAQVSGNRVLHRSDGSVAGTLPAPPSNRARERVPTHLDGRVMFRGDVAPTIQSKLLLTDGTTVGTVELLPQMNAIVTEQVAVNGQLFFPGSDTTNGLELWRTRGSAATTAMVANIAPGNANADPFGLARVGDRLYFSASESTAGRELWISDGTAGGTQRVKDIGPGLQDGAPCCIRDLDGVALFFANDGVNGLELWRSDGTEAGTTLVKDVTPGPAGSQPFGAPSVVNGVLYFVAGAQLWRSDATAAGTTPVDPTVEVQSTAPAAAWGYLFVDAVDGLATLNLLAREGPTWCAADERPIGDAATSVSTIRLPSLAALEDLDVSIDLYHPAVGDLVATLTHVDTGTSVTLIDRLQNVALARTCGGQLIDVTLDDEAALPAATQCAQTREALPNAARLRPLQSLAAFDGQNLGGTWTLTLSDAIPGGGLRGTAHGWCLRGTVANLAPEVTSATFAVPESVPNGTAFGVVSASDANGDALTFEIGGGNADSAFSIDVDGRLRVANRAALDYESEPQRVLTVVVRDDGAPQLSDMAAITIDVTDVDEAALAVDDAFVVAAGSDDNPLTVLANDVDPEGDAFAVLDLGAAAHGDVVRDATDPDAVLRYTPDTGYCNSAPGGTPDTFDYRLTSGSNATVSITVTCAATDAVFANGYE